MESTIEIVSVKDGKFHRPANTSFANNGNAFRDARLMRCGRSLVPLNVFETVADANNHTGNRLERYICQQCEKKVSHLWRVPEVLKNGSPSEESTTTTTQEIATQFADECLSCTRRDNLILLKCSGGAAGRLHACPRHFEEHKAAYNDFAQTQGCLDCNDTPAPPTEAQATAQPSRFNDRIVSTLLNSAHANLSYDTAKLLADRIEVEHERLCNRDHAFDALVTTLERIANETCDHGPMPFCPREEAHKALDLLNNDLVKKAGELCPTLSDDYINPFDALVEAGRDVLTASNAHDGDSLANALQALDAALRLAGEQ